MADATDILAILLQARPGPELVQEMVRTLDALQCPSCGDLMHEATVAVCPGSGRLVGGAYVGGDRGTQVRERCPECGRMVEVTYTGRTEPFENSTLTVHEYRLHDHAMPEDTDAT